MKMSLAYGLASTLRPLEYAVIVTFQGVMTSPSFFAERFELLGKAWFSIRP